MREIKFRQWDSVHKRYQFNIGVTGPGSWSGPSYVTWEKYPLEQYTGLHDKNGKEIYEGDILRHGYGDCRGAIVQVIYQSPSFIMKEKPKHKTWYTFILSPEQNQFEEILGNIHENPELLNAH